MTGALNRSLPIARAPSDAAVRAVGLRVCRFANGTCSCARRPHLCDRVEGEARAIIDALRTIDGGDA